MMRSPGAETIAAIATPPGYGGVGIVRISGPAAHSIARCICPDCDPAIGFATLTPFYDTQKQRLDEGLLLLFAAPRSFTGEDVAELQAHGSPVVLGELVQTACAWGARPARPGEFSERAFLNGKMDLAQAEAIADLISAGTAKGARAALASLQGAFSSRVHALVEAITQLRVAVESAIDFPEEEIDFLSEMAISDTLRSILEQLMALRLSANQGGILRDGLRVVLAGRPNVGKSSLLNALVGYEAAIVTDIPGTTRDLMRERIQIDGIPLHLVDSAGLREYSDDAIEREGMRRTWDTLEHSERIVLVTDTPMGLGEDDLSILAKAPADVPVFVVVNKIDLTGHTPGICHQTTPREYTLIYISVREHLGLDLLLEALRQSALGEAEATTEFMARRRHLVALDKARNALKQALSIAQSPSIPGELVAEELRQAQQALGEITGEVTNDALLDRIFREFCIGK